MNAKQFSELMSTPGVNANYIPLSKDDDLVDLYQQSSAFDINTSLNMKWAIIHFIGINKMHGLSSFLEESFSKESSIRIKRSIVNSLLIMGSLNNETIFLDSLSKNEHPHLSKDIKKLLEYHKKLEV